MIHAFGPGLNAAENENVSLTEPTPPPWAAAVAAPAQAPTKSNPVHYKITYATELKNVGNIPAEITAINIPLISEMDLQYQRVVAETLSHRPTDIEKGANGQRTAIYADVGVLRPGRSVTVQRHYEVRADQFDPKAQSLLEKDSALLAGYLQPEEGVESDHRQIKTLARRVAGDVSEVEAKVERIFNYVRSHLEYDLESPARNAGALAAWQHGSGVCSEFASLFAAMARAEGIPVRLVNGRVETWALKAGAPPPEVRNGETLRHQWAEFYHPELGWYPVDPTLSKDWRNSLVRPERFAENFGDRNTTARFRGGKISLKTTVKVEAVEQTVAAN